MYSTPSYGYSGYYSSTDPTPFLVISLVASLAATILLFVLVLPDKKRPTLNGFFKGIADIFNFRTLLIEKIVKFLYTFMTIFAVLMGFFMLFMQQYGQSLALRGLLIMLISPIAIRLFFEITMMAILLVKNVIEINNKLGYKKEEPKAQTPATVAKPQPKASVQAQAPVQPQAPDQPEAPAQPEVPAKSPVCANCGAVRVNETAPFCTNCGTKF